MLKIKYKIQKFILLALSFVITSPLQATNTSQNRESNPLVQLLRAKDEARFNKINENNKKAVDFLLSNITEDIAIRVTEDIKNSFSEECRKNLKDYRASIIKPVENLTFSSFLLFVNNLKLYHWL